MLRHTCASIMLEAGESVVTSARRLGHSSLAVTLGYYAQSVPEAGRKGRTAIDGLLGGEARRGGGSSVSVVTPQILPRVGRHGSLVCT